MRLSSYIGPDGPSFGIVAGAGLIDLRRRTPEGVAHARNPPPWLVPGDVVEVEIGGMGSLRDPVIDEPAEAA